MKARGKVRGILVEGSDGHEYLLGFRPSEQNRLSPMLSRRQPDGTFEPLADLQAASKLAASQLGISGPHVIGPGWGKEMWLWTAFAEALKTFPTVPTWPTWPTE